MSNGHGTRPRGPLVYSLGAASSGVPFAVAANGTITTTSSLDHDATSNYVIAVRATDPSGLSQTDVTIDDDDGDDAPWAWS